MVRDLAAADPVPLVIAWLTAHTGVQAALAGGHVGMRDEPPYPCVRVLDTGAGSDGDLRWLVSPELQFEALGDLDGSPGKAALHQVIYTVMSALLAVTDQPWPYQFTGAPSQHPVITWVASTRAAGWSPLPTGQPRYAAAARVWCHPPN